MEIEENLRKETPRELRTPMTESESILEAVDNIYCKFLGEIDGFFFDTYLEDMVENKATSGDTVINEMIEEASNEDGTEDTFRGILYVLFAASSYAVQAIKTFQQNNSGSERLAWTYAADARYWLGIALGDQTQRREQKSRKNKVHEKAAAIRHRENRAIKEAVIAHYEANEFKSRSKAAEAIAGKIVPVSYRTVINHLTEYHKKKNSLLGDCTA